MTAPRFDASGPLPPPPASDLPRRRPAWRKWAIAAAVVAVPVIEIVVLIKLVQWIGPWWTLLILLGEAALGIALIRVEGARIRRRLKAAGATETAPTADIGDAAAVLVGGILLALPGLLTDVLGLLCLLPFTRPLVRKLTVGWFERRYGSSVPLRRRRSRGSEVIEGEVVDDQSHGTSPTTGFRPRPEPDGEVIRGEIER